MIDPSTDPGARLQIPSRRGNVAGWLAWADAKQGGLVFDIVLYAASTIFASITAYNRMLPSHGAWARVAVWGYAAATILTITALCARRRGAAIRFTGTTGRAALTAVVFAGTGLLPLVLQSMQRAGGRLDRAQAEVLVIEAGGGRMWHTGTPYLSHDAIAALPASAWADAYLPYQPGMALYGLPHAIAGSFWWTDARVYFAATLIMTVLAAIWLIRRPNDAAHDRLLLRAIQAVSVLPICALTIATGGDDLAVLGLCVLAFALAARERFGAAGLAVGVAGAMKLFAWPVGIVVLMLAATRDYATAVRYTLGAIVLPVAALIPAFLIDPDAAVENVIRFPFGLGMVSSPAASPFPGHLIAECVPNGKTITTALLMSAGVAIGIWLLRRPPHTAAFAANTSALGLLAAILLAPATRFGYLLYPIAYMFWATSLSDPDEAKDEARISVETPTRMPSSTGRL